jgi:hypothetical protein
MEYEEREVKMALSRSQICDDICRKAKCTRDRPGQGTMSKRELLYVHSAIEIMRFDDNKPREESETVR